MNTIEKNIRTRIQELEITIRYACKKTNIPESSLYRMFERNDYKVSFLKKLANSLECTVIYFLNEDAANTGEIDNIKNRLSSIEKKIESV